MQGQNLKNLLTDKLLISQRQAVKEIGVSRPTLYKIIKDDYKPTALVVKKICNYFKVDYKDYL